MNESTISIASNASASIEFGRGTTLMLGEDLYLVRHQSGTTVTIIDPTTWRGRLFRLQLWAERIPERLRAMRDEARDWWRHGAPLRPAAARAREDELVDLATQFDTPGERP